MNKDMEHQRIVLRLVLPPFLPGSQESEIISPETHEEINNDNNHSLQTQITNLIVLAMKSVFCDQWFPNHWSMNQ